MIPGVPRGLHRGAFAAVAAHLQGHPLFANRRAVKSWFLRDGALRDDPPPPVAAMPAARLTLLGGPIRRLAPIARVGGLPRLWAVEHKPTVAVELWTPGRDAGDLADLSDLVIDALFPQDLTRHDLAAKLKTAGITDWELTRSILPIAAESFDPDWTSGQGSLELTIQFNC